MQELHEQSDAEIVRQIQSGDDNAFNELMRRYKRPVVNFVYRLLGNADDADDAAQEVFVRIYQNLDTYRPETKFSTWLFALARNSAIDRLRWRSRHPTESIESAPQLAARSGTADEVTAQEIGEEIAAAVAKLPEDQRTALVLAEYHGLSYAEIAGVMHCSEKSVESRLYRAKLALRSSLRHLTE
jgi:RNA polymerase sigma-70 factor (ECF subfamily)